MGSDYYTCSECGERVDCHIDNHRCPDPPPDRWDVEEMIEEALETERRRLSELIRHYAERMPNRSAAEALFAIVAALEIMTDGEGDEPNDPAPKAEP